MSRQFIESFVETCMDMGLSKEATAELLQHRSVIHAAEQSPAFAEGYLNNATPAVVRVRPGYVEKKAFGAAAKLIGSSLGGIARGAGGLLGAAGKGLYRTAVSNPRTAKALAGGAAAGGLGYGASNYLNNRDRAPGVPYMAPGGYNPIEEKTEYDNDLKRYSRGIAEANKTIDGAKNRRRVLEQAVNSNSPNSAQAAADLRALESSVSAAQKLKDSHEQRLKAQGAVTSGRLTNIQQRQQQLRERSQSPFWRGLHRITFRDPDKSYAEALDELQPAAAELSRQNQLISDQRKRMPYYLGATGNVPSSAQMQREFFPTIKK
jgi:hypothetical protein